MRDPELVARARYAATRLEQAWERWRTVHGLAGSADPLASYVGYSLREPMGQPRVVIGVDAAEAERFADFLENHECRVQAHVPAQSGSLSVNGTARPAAADVAPAPRDMSPELDGRVSDSTERASGEGPVSAERIVPASAEQAVPGSAERAMPGGAERAMRDAPDRAGPGGSPRAVPGGQERAMSGGSPRAMSDGQERAMSGAQERAMSERPGAERAERAERPERGAPERGGPERGGRRGGPGRALRGTAQRGSGERAVRGAVDRGAMDRGAPNHGATDHANIQRVVAGSPVPHDAAVAQAFQQAPVAPPLASPVPPVLPSGPPVLPPGPSALPSGPPQDAPDVIAAELAGWASGELPGQASEQLAAWAADAAASGRKLPQ